VNWTRKRLATANGRVRGLTLIELLVTMAILAILSAAVLPVIKVSFRREKEIQLRNALRTMRNGIDEFKKFSDQGMIQPSCLQCFGYPKDFEELVEGVPQVGAIDKKLRFLRRIPVDPLTGSREWGKRSLQDDADSSSWGRQNLYDVYSLSPGTALDESEYSDW
jgi:general secretion pathway protein G